MEARTGQVHALEPGAGQVLVDEVSHPTSLAYMHRRVAGTEPKPGVPATEQARRRYSQRKKRLARNPNTTAYPARTSSGCTEGNPVSIEDCIACTAGPSGV